MDRISLEWAGIITLVTAVLFVLFWCQLNRGRQRTVWLAAVASVYVYSGIGIALKDVDKKNALYYFIYIFVMGAFYILFVRFRFKSRSDFAAKMDRVLDVWDRENAKKIFIALVVMCLLLRTASLIYPVNHLTHFGLTYDSANNINNLTGRYSTVITLLTEILGPFFYIGICYLTNKTRNVALILTYDLLITLLYSGYFSRHELVTVVWITILHYINRGSASLHRAAAKKRRRAIVSLAVVFPILFYFMIVLMESRIASHTKYSFSDFIIGEIDYPKYYQRIHQMAPMVATRDFFLQLLDSFVPLIPTPKYNIDVNVMFSEQVLGVGMYSPYFFVVLPSALGEAFLVFGNTHYWMHAAVIALMLSMIYKLTREVRQLSILWYYYVACVLKFGRAGYEQLSQSVWLNFVVVNVVIVFVSALYKSGRMQYGKQER